MPMAFLNSTFHFGIQIPVINVHVSQRNINDFVPIVEMLYNANCSDGLVVNFYLTDKADTPLSAFDQINPARRITFIDSTNNFITDRRTRGNRRIVFVHKGRPDLHEIIRNSDVVGICGTHQITDQVSSICRQYGKKCYKETF